MRLAIVLLLSSLSWGIDSSRMTQINRALRALRAKHRAFIREKYGIYAANQGIFVTEESDLNSWDGGY